MTLLTANTMNASSPSSRRNLANAFSTAVFVSFGLFTGLLFKHSGKGALLRRRFLEDGASSLYIEPQTKSVFLRKLGDLFLSMFLVYRPNPSQVLAANHAPFAMHPFFDLFR